MRLETDEEADKQPVPATQFRVLIDELVQNALTAVEVTRNPKVLVKASIQRQRIFCRNALLVEVADNGTGMAPEIIKKATTPFFSTRGGNHVGLGLTGCLQMAATLNGKILIKSKPGLGTSVQIRVPVSAPPLPA